MTRASATYHRKRKSKLLSYANSIYRWDSQQFLSDSYVRRTEEDDISIEGDPFCPCLPLGSLEPIGYNDLTDIYKEEIGDVDFKIFGYGCKAHDNQTSAFCLKCEDPALCEWCFLPWCYVDPLNCRLKSTRFEITPINVSIRHYSYATCRSLDGYTGPFKVSGMNGKIYRVGITHDAGGFSGAYHKNKSNFVGPLEDWSGALIDFIKVASEKANFSMTIMPPPEFLRNASINQIGNTTFDECVFATSLGYLDFCIGSYAASTARVTATDFIILSSNAFKLLRMGDMTDNSWTENLGTIFQPFRYEAWYFIALCVIPVMGLLFVVHEWNKKGSLYPKSTYVVIRHKDSHMEEIEERKVPFYRHMIRSIYMSFVSVLQGGYGNPLMTQGARIHLIGFSFFILTLLAVYTANLAAILQFQLIVPQVISLESAIRQNYKICALREVAAITMQNYPKIQPTSFIFDPVDGKPGFYTSIDRQSLVMDSINEDESKREAAANIPHSIRKFCRAALAFDQDLQLAQGSGKHCDKVFVGESVGSLDVGIPLFEDVSYELSYLLLSLKNDGYFQTAIFNHTPTDRCTVKAELSILTRGEGGKSLTISELSGIWIVSFGFAFIGLLITFISYTNSKRNKTIVRPLYRMNQHGERLNRLERDDEWIRQEGIRVQVDQHGHLKWSEHIDPTLGRSQVRSTLAEKKARKQMLIEKMQAEYVIPPDAFRSYDLPEDYLDDSTRSTEASESGADRTPKGRKKKKIRQNAERK